MKMKDGEALFWATCFKQILHDNVAYFCFEGDLCRVTSKRHSYHLVSPSKVAETADLCVKERRGLRDLRDFLLSDNDEAYWEDCFLVLLRYYNPPEASMIAYQCLVEKRNRAVG